MRQEKKKYKEATLVIAPKRFDFYELSEYIEDGGLVAVDYSDGKIVNYAKGTTSECIGILEAGLGKGKKLDAGERGKVIRAGEINIDWLDSYKTLDTETVEQLKIKDLYFKEFSKTETRREID